MNRVYAALIVIIILYSLVGLTQNKSQLGQFGIADFTSSAYQLDLDYQSSLLDQKMAEARSQATDILFRSQLSVIPFSEKYKIQEPTALSANSYEEKGVKFGFTQSLPTGTQITLGVDRFSENSRSTTFAKENVYTFAVTQPLLQNQFGEVDRLNSMAAEIAVLAQKIRTEISKNETCIKAASVFIDAWTQTEKEKFISEVTTLSEDLYKKSQTSFNRGQISKMDWLGVQSDYLNLKNLSSQNQQKLKESRTNLEILAPQFKDRNPEDPSAVFSEIQNTTFIEIQEKLKDSGSRAAIKDIEYFQKTSQAAAARAQAEKSNSLPQLDLKVSQQIGQGKIINENYKEDAFMVSLNLHWKLNDGANDAQYILAQLEYDKSRLKEQDLIRVQHDNFKKSFSDLSSKSDQLKYEKARTGILAQITDENRKRFLQGRIEFQDFLRVKEQWFDNQNNFLEKQSQYWKTLIEFSLRENLPVYFCRGQ